MTTRIRKPQRLIIGGAALLLLLTSITGYRAMTNDEAPDVYAVFANASPLIEGNDVKISGVTVGKVESIEVREGQALVGMSLDEEAMPLHQDAKATIRPLSLLGERFVELDRGTADAPTLASGDRIPVKNTSSAVDIDQVLNALDEPTGQALAALLTTVGHGMADRGQKIDGTIKALRPAMQDTGALVKVLNQQRDALADMVTQLQPVVSAVAAEDGKKLDRLLRSTAAKQKELDATLVQLPGTLSTGRQTLRALRGAAGATTPTLANLRPTTSVLTELSNELSAFAKVGAPAMKDLEPVLDRARTLLKAAAPVAQSLRASSPDVLATARGLQPIGTELISNLRNVLDFAKFWALTTNNGDGLSNYFRSMAVINTEPVTGLLPQPGTSPAKKSGPAQQPKDLVGGLLNGGLVGDLSGIEDLTDGLVTGLGGLLGGASAGRSVGAVDPVNVTGLTARQEQDMVTYLVGGAR